MATVSYQYKVVKPEFERHAGSGDQDQPDLAVLNNGNVEMIEITGSAAFPDELFLISYVPNGYSSSAANFPGISSQPAVAALSNGGFATVGVTSQATGSAGGSSIVLGINQLPLEFLSLILGNQADNQAQPDVAGLIDDRLVAVWTDDAVELTPTIPQLRSDIRMSVLNNAGTELLKSDIGVAEGLGNQRDAAVAALSTGGFVVTYSDFGLASAPFIMAQRYDSEGNKVGGLIGVDTVGVNDQSDVVGLDNGGFAVAYFDGETGVSGISLRIFNASGIAVGSRTQVSTGDGNSDPSITKMSNGALTVSWTHNVSGTNNDLYMRSFSANSVALTGEFRFQGTDIDAINQREAAIAAAGGGSIIAAWTDDAPSQGGGTHIAGAHYALQRTTTGDATAESLVGDSLVDVINGLGGNDFLHSNSYGVDGLIKSGAGDDTLNGGDGNDGLFAGDGNDTLDGGAQNDGMVGGAGDDTLNGGAGSDFLFGGAFGPDGSRLANSGIDTLNGGAGNDGLYGFDGGDQIDGGGDNDYVEGGAGNDFIIGGDGSDYLLGQENDDIVNGGLGFDYLYGGSGADTFIFRKSFSADWILDFKASEGDKLRLPDFGYANFAAIPLVDLSTPGNPAVQFTFSGPGGVDQLTIFGVTLAQLNATNVLVV